VGPRPRHQGHAKPRADFAAGAPQPDVAPTEGFRPRSKIRLMPFDPAVALAEDGENKMPFLEIFGG